jgi:hypothetical protein
LRQFGAVTTTNAFKPALPSRRRLVVQSRSLVVPRAACDDSIKLIGEARREIHETCGAISAWQGPCASGVDQSRVEEGQRQREFGNVRNGSFDEAAEPRARGGEGADQAVVILAFQSATFAARRTGRENGAPLDKVNRQF